MFGNLYNPSAVEPDVRIILCPLVSEASIPPSDGTLDECEVCHQPVRVGGNQRQLIVEFEAIDAAYVVRCTGCKRVGYDDTDEAITLSAGLEADRLALLRGAAPRHALVIVTLEDIPAIVAANPGFNPLFRF